VVLLFSQWLGAKQRFHILVQPDSRSTIISSGNLFPSKAGSFPLDVPFSDTG
jgi:hypothetical protein